MKKIGWLINVTSGVPLIEIIAALVLFGIVIASIQPVSNGRGAVKPPDHQNTATNQVGRDFHAPADVIHTYAPPH